MVLARAYKRREGMQLLYEHSSNVGGEMCAFAKNRNFISCSHAHSSAHV